MGNKSAKNKKGKLMQPLLLLSKGYVVDYQTVIEQTFGDWISSLSAYDPNYDRKTMINGVSTESDRAYFVPDEDYEIIIRKRV